MMLPRVRGRFVLERERDLEDLILSFDPDDLALALRNRLLQADAQLRARRAFLSKHQADDKRRHPCNFE